MRELKIYWLMIPLDFKLQDLSHQLNLLDSEEFQVYKRYKVDFKKIEFLLGRLLLKNAIGETTLADPQSVRFIKNEYGKLFLADLSGVDGADLQFNLTHSERMIACVISSRTVGIDAECTVMNNLNLAPQILSLSEAIYLDSIPSATRLYEFYRIWTQKEAYVKAVGKGFTIEPNTITIPIEGEWEYFTFSPCDSYLLSIVVARQRGIDSILNLQEVDVHELLQNKWQVIKG
jgi:4'-phosphopantetheinyl transferase